MKCPNCNSDRISHIDFQEREHRVVGSFTSKMQEVVETKRVTVTKWFCCSCYYTSTDVNDFRSKLEGNPK